jgi:hypothetical protein
MWTFMSKILSVALLLTTPVALADGAQLLEGRWIARGYLNYGVENGKVTRLPKMTLSPEHLGRFMYDAGQALQFKLRSPEDSALSIRKAFIRHDRRILHPACRGLTGYKNSDACISPPGDRLKGQFKTYELSSGFPEDEKVFAGAWRNERLHDLSSGFILMFEDYTLHNGYVGRDHLLLRSTYYEKPVKGNLDALKNGCPAGNRCWTVFLRFDRVGL